LLLADAANSRRQCESSRESTRVFDEATEQTEQRQQFSMDSPSTRQPANAENADWRHGECGAEAGIGPDGIGRRRLAGSGEFGNATDDGSLTEQQPREQEEERRMHQPKGSSFWADADWLYCADGKLRPISPEPALFPLAPRLPGHVGLLRGSGNSIVPQVAQVFIEAYLELKEKVEAL
jgi:hypothetical protein